MGVRVCVMTIILQSWRKKTKEKRKWQEENRKSFVGLSK